MAGSATVTTSHARGHAEALRRARTAPAAERPAKPPPARASSHGAKVSLLGAADQRRLWEPSRVRAPSTSCRVDRNPSTFRARGGNAAALAARKAAFQSWSGPEPNPHRASADSEEPSSSTTAFPGWLTSRASPAKPRAGTVRPSTTIVAVSSGACACYAARRTVSST